MPKAVRSRIMSAIRGKGNERTDRVFARLLRQNGITGWRRNPAVRLASRHDQASIERYKRLKLRPWVRPDFVFPGKHLAVFLDGCFWHGCARCYRRPRSNRAFWAEKVDTNRRRDRIQTAALRRKGWVVIRVWEHQLTDRNGKLNTVIARIRAKEPPANHR